MESDSVKVDVCRSCARKCGLYTSMWNRDQFRENLQNKIDDPSISISLGKCVDVCPDKQVVLTTHTSEDEPRKVSVVVAATIEELAKQINQIKSA